MFSSDGGREARVAIIGIASLILVALMVVGLTVGINIVDEYKKNGYVSSSLRGVDDICRATDYKERCRKTLGNVDPAIDDPGELIKAALYSALEEMSIVSGESAPLKELGKVPKTAMAAQSCKQLLSDAADDLRRSLGEIGKLELSNMEKTLSNLNVWLSATVTYQETCIDGFDSNISEAGEEMRELLNASMEMSSNGLAMAAAALGDLQLKGVNALRSSGRRLLEDPIPVWLDFEHRRQKMEDVEADVVVAQDGSGEFRTIGDALRVIPMYGDVSFVIYVKEGVYREQLTVEKWHTCVVLVGDGPTKTRIVGDSSFVDGTPSSQTSTLTVRGDHFMAKHIGVENTAGPRRRRAVAVKVQSDQSIFYNCHFGGHQNTLHAHTYRQFYRGCHISGAVDLIFGDALAFFQNCTILVRKPFDKEPCTVSAQGRKDRHQPTGIVMQNCKFTSHPDFYPPRSKGKAYLGRLSKEYSRTIIMESEIGDFIDPDGWLLKGRESGLNTCYFGVYKNQGRRVKWAGVKTLSDAQAENFMPLRFCLGDDWIKASGAPYLPVLSSSSKSPLPASLAKPPTITPSEVSSLMAILEGALTGVPREDGRSTMVNLERSLMQSNRDEIDQMKKHRMLKDENDPEDGRDDDDDLNNNDDDDNKPPPPMEDDDDDNADDDNDDHDRVVDPQKPSKMDSVLHKIQLKAGSDSSMDEIVDQSESPSPSSAPTAAAPIEGRSTRSISLPPEIGDLERELMDDVRESVTAPSSDDSTTSMSPEHGGSPSPSPAEDMAKGVHMEMSTSSAPSSGSSPSVTSDLEKQLLNEDSKLEKGDGDEVGSPVGGPAPSPEAEGPAVASSVSPSPGGVESELGPSPEGAESEMGPSPEGAEFEMGPSPVAEVEEAPAPSRR